MAYSIMLVGALVASLADEDGWLGFLRVAVGALAGFGLASAGRWSKGS